MSDLIGKLIDGVDKDGQIQSAISGLKQRMADADRKRKLNQLKQQIQELQTQESQAISSLSAQVLALHEAGTLTQPELISLCRRVDEVRVQVKDKEAELQKLQPTPPTTTAEARCPKCGSPVVVGAVFCQACGGPLKVEPAPVPTLFCIHCGTQLRQGARFCPTCGKTTSTG
jgi:uncharacterized Zn finger protein (UPF0148 family)